MIKNLVWTCVALCVTVFVVAILIALPRAEFSSEVLDPPPILVPDYEDPMEKDAETLRMDADIHRALELLKDIPHARSIDEDFLRWGGENVSPQFVERMIEGLEAAPADGELFYDLYGQTLHVLWDHFQGSDCPDEDFRDAGEEAPVRLAFTGDVNLGDNWENMKAFRKQPDSVGSVISPSLLERLRGADILMVNNEFCFSDRGSPTPGKQYTFRASSENVELLQELGVDIVSVANNHAFDYGSDAFTDTLEALAAAGIPAVGAGLDATTAGRAEYFHAGGMKIAYLAAGDTQAFYHTPTAAEDTPGILACYGDEGKRLLQLVDVARRNADWVIVYLHWGIEYESMPNAAQVDLAHKLVAGGADIVVGAHPHVLQSIELYEGKPIVYSLGNFWFNVGWVDTALLEIELASPNEYALRIQPCKTAQGTVRLLEDDWERRALFNLLEGISAGIAVDDEGIVSPLEQGIENLSV